MTDFLITDPLTSKRARVDDAGRVQSLAVSHSAATEAALDGDRYNINTFTVNLTTAGQSGLLYMKNEETDDDINWIYDRVFYNIGASTGGSGHILAEVIKNSTAGTLISGGTTLAPINLNFSSANTLSGTTLKGAEGSTITDGSVAVSSIIPSDSSRIIIPFDSIVLQPGASIAIRITPPTGNASLDIQVGFNMYRWVELS
jgi:hypothetical protein